MRIERFGKPFGIGLLIVGGVYLLLFLFALAVHNFVDSVPYLDSTADLHSIAAMLALFLGGLYVVLNLQALRTFIPHLSVIHEISDRRIGRGLVHISVNVLMENTSRIEVKISKGHYRLEVLAPPPGRRAAMLHQLLCGCDHHGKEEWQLLARGSRPWKEGELIVEPGQKQSVLYEFEVSTSVRMVKITTSFDTPNTTGNTQYADKWGHTSVYDITSTDRSPWMLFG